MLTASQCRYVAYYTDDGPTCRACAVAANGADDVVRAEEGLSATTEPIIAYSLGEYITAEHESTVDYLEQDHGPAQDWDWGIDGVALVVFKDGHRESLPNTIPCAHCDAELSD